MAGLVTTINMTAGTYIDISTPTDLETGQGQFPKKSGETIKINGVIRTHIYGFISENELIGTVEEVPGTDVKVRYSHKKSEANRIYFYTANDEKYTIAIIAMPIHDHSSIQQGGPAFGTYYSDHKPDTP
ncbi:hypothetical protein JZU46_06945 [bacterium]|nr:hypothetical protein [bacterium]